jgi:hypothetical protein
MRLGSKKAIPQGHSRRRYAVGAKGGCCELRAALCALLPLLIINNMRFSWS